MSFAFRSSLCSLGLILCLLGSPAVRSQSSSPADDPALRVLLNDFHRAWSERDLAGYLRCWAGGAPGLDARRKVMERVFQDHSRIEVGAPIIRKAGIREGRARLRVDVEMKAVDAKTGAPAAGFGLRRRVMEFVQQNGAWRVWRDESAIEDLAATLAETADEAARNSQIDGEKDLWLPDLPLALNRLGIRSASQGQYPRALEIFRIALSTAERIGDPAGIGASAGNIGLIHFNQGDYELALEPMQKSLRLGMETRDQTLIANTWNNLGLLYQGQGNYELARDAYEKSLEIALQRKNQNSIATAYGNLGNLYSSQGRYALAAETYQKSRAAYREASVKSGEGRILHSLGNIQYYQGNLDLALRFYREALAVKEATGNVVEQSRTLNSLGRLLTLQGEYARAEEYHRKALAINEASDTKGEIARSHYFLGDLFAEKGELSHAMESFRRSLARYEAIGEKKGEGDTLNGVARTALLQGEPGPPLEASQRAIAIARRIGGLEMLWTGLTQAGKAWLSLGRIAEARQAFEEAIAVIETLRGQMAGGALEGRGFFEAKISPYHELIALAVDRGRFEEALVLAERAKARSLLDLLQEGQQGRGGIQKAMTVDEREQEQRLKADLVRLNTFYTRAAQEARPDARRLADLDARLRQARLNYEAMQATLYASHPELKVQRGEAPTIRAEELAALVPESGGALLEYVVTEEKVWLFTVTRSAGRAAAVRAYPLPVRAAELNRQIENYRRQLANRDLGFRVTAAELSRLLLAPAAAELRGRAALHIVPDGKLWELPFQALLVDGRYLVERASVAYAPSLTVLREMARRRPGGDGGLLAFGNPLLNPDTIERAARSKPGTRLDPLPEAERVVKALGRLYGPAHSKVYVGAEAREDRAKTEAARAGILHFATHGVLNDAAPMYSHLAFAPGEKSEDGLLEAWELMQLDLHADLAVLSACETARGRIRAGEGVIGLSWAMFVAGVPATVVSQWKVESAATHDLMLDFHRRLQAPPAKPQATKAEALRQAALAVMKRPATSHPFYWAGFVLVGDEH
ncbi:MAG: CHAT domain-containing protein [Blastocatellia bacterium]|nr:CHAT domain-containing protein [Blastocatellia bacterium]